MAILFKSVNQSTDLHQLKFFFCQNKKTKTNPLKFSKLREKFV